MSDKKDPQRISDAADNCEVLRARLAKYEDAEGRPFVVLSEQADELLIKWTDRALKAERELAALKDQPGEAIPSQEELIKWALGWRESDRRDGLSVEADMIERITYAIHYGMRSRLNSSPVSAGDKDGRAMAMLVAEAAYKAGNGVDRAVASNTLRQIVDGVFEQLGFAGVVDERAAFEAWFTDHSKDWPFPSESIKSMARSNDWLVWQARAALTASAPNHSEQVREVVPVPVAPTDEMLNAGKSMLHKSNGRGAREKCGRIFSAMLAAAPSAGSQEQGE